MDKQSIVGGRLRRFIDSIGLQRAPGFLAVGVSGLGVNTAALWLFTELAGAHYLVSAIAATQVSTSWNFLLHDRLVFDRHGRRFTAGGRFARYWLVNNAGLLLRAPLLALLVEWAGLHYILANLLALLVLTSLRFLGAQVWIWAGGARQYVYQVHDLLAVQSEVALPELAPFTVTRLHGPPDIVVRQGAPARPLAADSIAYHDGLGRLGFKIWIERAGAVNIWASSFVCASPHVLYTNVVEPVLRWTLAANDHALVHGAAIAFRGRGGLITAATDTGKTTTVLQTLESKSWQFLSDDMTILSRSGELMSFPKPMTISAHTLQAVHSSRLNWRERLFLPLQSRLHSRAGRWFGMWLAEHGLPAASLNALVQRIIPPPKYAIERLIPWTQAAASCNLTTLILLDRTDEAAVAMTHAEIVEALLHNADDAYGFPPYAELAPFLSTWDGRDLAQIEREIITNATRDLPATRLASRQYRWSQRLPWLFRSPPANPGYFEADTQPTAITGS